MNHREPPLNEKKRYNEEEKVAVLLELFKQGKKANDIAQRNIQYILQ
ncbi:MAG TPA: hypothetical protein PLB48_06560 [Treponema sp.]|nr:hypothetical protein [Treponema sp.]HRS04614.1 hypothetical protein [Treponema sp.]HRU29073.1 hypothetical protein [Treponema sp.]